jgi:hypothetical protein
LHPAYVVGKMVVGVCKKLVDHPIYHAVQNVIVPLPSKDDPKRAKWRPMTGEKYLKCQEFMGNWGTYSYQKKVKNFLPNSKKKYSYDVKSKHTHQGQSVDQVTGRAMAFTCGRAYAHDASKQPTLFAVAIKTSTLKSLAEKEKVRLIEQHFPLLKYYKFNKAEDMFKKLFCKDVRRGKYKYCKLCTVQLERVVQSIFASCNSDMEDREHLHCTNEKNIEYCLSSQQVLDPPKAIACPCESARRRLKKKCLIRNAKRKKCFTHGLKKADGSLRQYYSYEQSCQAAFHPKRKAAMFQQLTRKGLQGHKWHKCGAFLEREQCAIA